MSELNKLEAERLIRAKQAFGLYDFGDLNILDAGGWLINENELRTDFRTLCSLSGSKRNFNFVVRFEPGEVEVSDAYIAA